MIKSVMTVGLMAMAASVAHAENVEIYLLDMLDNTQSEYCIDIVKGKEE